MALPPFNPTGYAVSTSAVTAGSGTKTFVLDTDTVSIPEGFMAQAVAASDADQWMIGQVLAADATTVTLLVGTEENIDYGVGDGAVELSGWHIKVVDRLAPREPFYSMSGLRIVRNGSDAFGFDVLPGSVMDSTNTVVLTLSGRIYKKANVTFAAGDAQGAFVRVGPLTGTIARTGGTTTVNGTGTTFLTDFGTAPYLSDYSDQVEALNLTPVTLRSVIRTVALGPDNFTATTDTAGTSSLTTAISAGTAYYRGGYPLGGGDLDFAILAIRRDSDGELDICTSAFNGTGVPDLPSGYTYYRVIGRGSAPTGQLEYYQPMAAATADVGQYFQGFTPSSTTTNPFLYWDETNERVDTHSFLGLDNVDWNSYTPTVTGVANIDSVSVNGAQFMRVGGVVTVSGSLSANPTAAAGTITRIGISLPVASNIASAWYVAGAGGATSNTIDEKCVILGDTTNDRAEMRFFSQNSSAHDVAFHFTYVIGA